MHIIGIIPARYGSTRFPAKVLLDLGGKTMLERVYRQACAAKSLSEVWIATDDERVQTIARQFTDRIVMTANTHPSGTDRCAEALRQIQVLRAQVYDFVVNIQADEPFIHPEQIDELGYALQPKSNACIMPTSYKVPTASKWSVQATKPCILADTLFLICAK
jgi:3-deoxy-manno-octulosonate cytidylyltransferase (CMP-KDO synthetase)